MNDVDIYQNETSKQLIYVTPTPPTGFLIARPQPMGGHAIKDAFWFMQHANTKQSEIAFPGRTPVAIQAVPPHGASIWELPGMRHLARVSPSRVEVFVERCDYATLSLMGIETYHS